jgi:hypothetical protein
MFWPLACHPRRSDGRSRIGGTAQYLGSPVEPQRNFVTERAVMLMRPSARSRPLEVPGGVCPSTGFKSALCVAHAPRTLSLRGHEEPIDALVLTRPCRGV